jgi:hypothetical protein
MPSEGIQESHPHDPHVKRFVIHTLCQVIAQAQYWDEVVSGCEALANALRIAKDRGSEPIRPDFQAVTSIDHLKALGQQIREYENGGSDGKTRQTSIQSDLRKDAQVVADKGDNKPSQKREEK